MSCASCRGRFKLPVVAGDRCEVCTVLHRLNRVILTRHPAAESETLVRLLTRAVNKVEAFVEEWEANEALGGAFTGGLPLTQASGETPATGESRTLGLTPTAKSSSKARHQPPGGSPEKREEDKGEEACAAGSRPDKSPPPRSRSKKSKRDRSRRRRDRRRSAERSRDRRRRKVKGEPEEAAEARSPKKEEAEDKVEKEEETDESPTRDDRKSPTRRDDGEGERKSPEERRIPRSPSRSPPGFARAGALEDGRDRTPIARAKPKKDKGRNHYLRGAEFRARYGYDRGRGRGAPRW